MRLRRADSALGHAAEFGYVVAGFGEHGDQFVIARFGEGFASRHDPGVFAVGNADDGGLVVIVQVHDEVGGLEGPDEAHAPLGARLAVVDEAARAIGFQGAVEAVLVEGVGGGDGAVLGEAVGFDAVVGFIFDEGGDVGDDIPVAHETFEVDWAVEGAQRFRARGASGGRRGLAAGVQGREGGGDEQG